MAERREAHSSMTDDLRWRHRPVGRGRVLFGLGLVVLMAMAGCAPRGVPLPNDVKVIPPSSDAPRQAAAFSGKWVGAWDIKIAIANSRDVLSRVYLDHVLVVERIEGNKAHVLYAWGAVEEWGLKAGFTRDVGTLRGNVLKVVRRNGSIVDYEISEKGDRLKARYERLGRVGHAVMWRPERMKTH
jgi:hypothetical protein